MRNSNMHAFASSIDAVMVSMYFKTDIAFVTLSAHTRTNFIVLSGPCTSTAGCVASPNFPNNYGNSELCEILAPDQSLYFTHFATEGDSDFLTIDGQAYSGSSSPPQGTTSSGIILWSTSADSHASGWQLCTANALKLGTERERSRETKRQREHLCWNWFSQNSAFMCFPTVRRGQFQAESARSLLLSKSNATYSNLHEHFLHLFTKDRRRKHCSFVWTMYIKRCVRTEPEFST